MKRSYIFFLSGCLKKASRFVLLASSLSLIAANQPSEEPVPLDQRSFHEILKRYTFVGDFEPKETTRHVSDKEVFWRYPMKIPPIVFSYEELPKTKAERLKTMPFTPGSGRAVQHLNRARQLYGDGEYLAARNTLLGAINRYGREFEASRRTDFFLGIIFRHLAEIQPIKTKKQTLIENSVSFLAQAYKVKKDMPDDFVEQQAPKYFYQISATYYNFERYGAAYGMADTGLNWLRKTGRSDYRVKLRRIFAESYIRNGSYLEAAQEFDVALREPSISAEDASQIFARVGDIYFDLNNFELAEEAYALAIQIDREFGYVRPAQYVFRGESLFWLKRFSEAQKMFHYALEAAGRSVDELPTSIAAVASIRIADAWLAQVDRDLVENEGAALKKLEAELKRKYRGDEEKSFRAQLSKAREHYAKSRFALDRANVGYSAHIRKFPDDHTADHARIRMACLNLPEYGGENIRHAREILNQLKNGKRHNDLLNPAPDFDSDAEKKKNEAQKKQAEEKAKAEKEKAAEAKDGGKAEAKSGEAESNGEKVVSAEEPEKSGHEGGDEHGKEKKDKKNKNSKPKGKAEPPPPSKPIVVLEPLPPESIHMAWGCEVASFAQHERTDSMVELVRTFAKLYPQSTFFKKLEEPVRVTQAKGLAKYFADGDIAGATVFFEQNRKLLFADITANLTNQLFEAYVDLNQSEKAEEFFDAYKGSIDSELKAIRAAVFTAETSGDRGTSKRNLDLGHELDQKKWTIENSPAVLAYLDRIIGSGGAAPHYKWMLNLETNWTKKDYKEVCQLTYPIYSKIWQNPDEFGLSTDEFEAQFTKMIEEQLPELMQFNTYCSYSILELEQNIYEQRPRVLFDRLMARKYMTINEFTGKIYWQVSEILNKAGYKKEAEEIWTKLRDAQGLDIREVEYAKARLDKRKTEVEGLWQ